MKRPIAYFAGTGRGIPATVMTNYDFAAIGIETTDEWIVERTGIKERHIAETGRDDLHARRDGVASGDGEGRRAAPASSTSSCSAPRSPDRLLPSTAVDLQAALGATRAAAFDVAAACSGFSTACTVAEGMIAAGHRRHGARRRRREDERDRRLEGSLHLRAVRRRRRRGGAQALEARQGNPLDVPAQRRNARRPALPARRRRGAARSPTTVLAERSQFVKMDGREVFKHAVRSMSEAATRALDGAKLTGADIDLMIPHQANIRIIEATAKHAEHPDGQGLRERRSLRQHVVGVDPDRARRGDRDADASARDRPCCSCAFGAGFTWGSMVVRF